MSLCLFWLFLCPLIKIELSIALNDIKNIESLVNLINIGNDEQSANTGVVS
ncbi:protein of unknown function [Shewanella benthica]|uniref:Uncharacterized protein n=1 Tax=Shewanella benthica TaxID=43661 RepID=A0A330M712_9GAMM|nr:protein of unknown function [Shewanella benthica]